MADEYFDIPHATLGSPSVQNGVFPTIVEDFIEPRYPEDGELLLFRRGELTPAVPRIIVPHGYILCWIEKDQAVHVRDLMRRFRAQQEEALRRRAERGQKPRGV